MKAFAEWIWSPSAVIRVGAACDRYSAPFEYAVSVVYPWRSLLLWPLGRLFGFRPTAIIKALVNPTARPIELPHQLAVIRTIKRQGFQPDWERFLETRRGKKLKGKPHA